MLERAHQQVSALVRTSARLHDLFFRETPEYPPFAWQEVIVNALAHRDYSIESNCVEVWVYEDRMEIKSPGALLPEVKLEELLARKGVHATRNPRVARVLTELGIMRQQGEGIPRMIEEMELSWLPAPELREDARQFMVVLRNEPLFQGSDETWTRAVRSLPLEVRQKRALVAFGDGREFASGDYQELNRVDRDEAYRELADLQKRGLLTPSGSGVGRGAKYRVIKTAVPPTAAAPSPMKRLEERLTAVGAIRNADVRDTLGVGREEAKRLLAAWVRVGALVLEGERRGARYTRGLAWPPSSV